MVDRPAHVHGGRRRPDRVRPDRRSLLTRLPVVLVLGAALAGAVAVDARRDVPADGSVSSARPDLLMAASRPADADSSTWYCAAGTAVADGEADHTVVVFNPTDDALQATLTVYAGDLVDSAAPDGVAAEVPVPVIERVSLPAGRQVEVRLGDLVDAPLAAALVEVDGGDVAVEHRVAGRHGQDTAPCTTTAAGRWHVAWGTTTRDARDIVVLFNPFPSAATVDAVFTTEDGGREPVRFQGLPLPAGSVVGVDLGDDVTRSEHVSATFEARSGSIVVEHLQIHDGSLGTRGLAVTPGVPAAGETWVFAASEATAPSPETPAPDAGSDDADAETDADAGTDGADDVDADADADVEGNGDVPADEPIVTERIVVYNPGQQRAEVEVNAIPLTDEPVPAPQPFRLRIGPGDYEVVDYGAEERIAPAIPHTTVVRSTNGVPVVAERVTADKGPVPERTRRTPRGETPARRSETSATPGARLAAPRWRFPSLADPEDERSTVTFTVFNPDPTEAVAVGLDVLVVDDSDADDVAVDPSADDEGAAEADGADRAPPARASSPRAPLGARETVDGALVDEAEMSEVAAPVDVPPGGAVSIELDARQAASGRAAIVVADGPVVVDRVVRRGDGRRITLGLGIPAAAGAVPLDDLAEDGPIGGVFSE